MHYLAEVKMGEDGVHCVTFPDCPGCITDGTTLEEALINASAALDIWLTFMLEHRKHIPVAKAEWGQNMYTVTVPAHLEIAILLRKARGQRPLTSVASIAGISPQAFNRLEHPSKGNPTIKTLENAARALGKRLVVSLVDA